MLSLTFMFFCQFSCATISGGCAPTKEEDKFAGLLSETGIDLLILQTYRGVHI